MNNGNLSNCFYPRLQYNARGEIILAIRKKDTLTEGILVGKTSDCKSTSPIGQHIVDWEVCGELLDYNGDVAVNFSNEYKCEKEHISQKVLLETAAYLKEKAEQTLAGQYPSGGALKAALSVLQGVFK